MGDNLQEMKRFSNDLTETEKKEEEKDLKELQQKTNKMICKAKGTAKSLRRAADKLDEVWKDCKIAHATGSATGIVGGLLTIAGGIATICTAGAAMPLLLLGMGVGAAGAGTNLVTSIVEACNNSTEIKKAEKELKETLDSINDVNNIVQLWLDRKEEAKLLYLCCLAVRTLELSDPVRKILQEMVLRSLGLPADIVEATGKIVLEAGKGSAKAAGEVAQSGVTAGAKGAGKIAGKESAKAAGEVAESGAKAGAKGAGKIAGGLIIGVSAAFIVFDAIDLGFTIKDLVENKGSEAARILREKAKELEKVC